VPNSAVVPDYVAPKSLSEFGKEKDTQLEQLFELINK